ncbi:phage terminase large subunit [Pedobacter immunditicola]|uniref:phage terminase large subunit n=1 Tax=Pedobacter immunditicola TaxID=3133440 RepID=UPI0030A72771
MNLTLKQTIVLDILEDNQTTEVIFGGGAGGGKSIVGCYWILKNCLKYKGTRWLIGRSKLKSLKETTLNSLFDVIKLQGLRDKEHFIYNQQTGVIKFFNGSQIILKDLFTYPSDPNFDQLGSLEISGAFIDECNQISEKAWLIVKSRIRYKLDEYGLIPKILGTCNPSKNWVYSNFFKLHKDNKLEAYKAFIQALATDNPYISQHYINNLHTLDQASKERLLFGNWDYDNDPSSLLEFEQILDLFTNSHILPDPTNRALTCDIAMQGADKMVITYWSGFVAEKIKVYPKTDGKQVIDAIELMANTYQVPKSRIVYDADGVGSFVGGYLQGAKAFHNGGKALNNENYKNQKTQCIYKFCERAASGGYYIKDQVHKQDIIKELEQLKRTNIDNDTGKLEVISKDIIKSIIGHSPDFSDALIMREYLELKRKGFFV